MAGLYDNLGIIRSADRPNNSVAYIKEVEDPDNNRCIKYMCYPGLRGVALDTPRWKVTRAITYYKADGSIDYHTFDYPEGSDDYRFCPDLVETYNYKFSNV